MIPLFSRQELKALYEGLAEGRMRISVAPGGSTTLTAKDIMEELLLVLDGPEGW
jgi:hypothetical protein